MSDADFNAQWVVGQVLEQMRAFDKKISAQLAKQEEALRKYHQEIEKLGHSTEQQIIRSLEFDKRLSQQEIDIAEIRKIQNNVKIERRKIVGFLTGAIAAFVAIGEFIRWWFDVR